MLTQKMKQPFKTAQPVLFPPLADRAAWESLPGAARWGTRLYEVMIVWLR